MELMKVNRKVTVEEFTNSEEENINQILSQMGNEEIVIFTDGSALGNPGRTGAVGGGGGGVFRWIPIISSAVEERYRPS